METHEDPALQPQQAWRQSAQERLLGPMPRSPLQLLVPITVFDMRGIPGQRRERIEAEVVAGEKQAAGPHEAWIIADPFRGGFKVLITGPHGFERTVAFAFDDDPAVVAERVREAVDE